MRARWSYSLNVSLRKTVLSTEFQDGPGGKRSKFVVTGHGKYEKVSVDDGWEDTNCQSGKTLNHPSFCQKHQNILLIIVRKSHKSLNLQWMYLLSNVVCIKAWNIIILSCLSNI